MASMAVVVDADEGKLSNNASRTEEQGPSHLGVPNLGAFARLLAQLGQEHDREISQLEKEVGLLREQLSVGSTSHLKADAPSDDRESGRLSTNGVPFALGDSWKVIDTGNTSMIKPLANESDINWDLEDMPEEPFVATQFVDFCANTWIGRSLGLTKERADRWNDWWRNLEEPERPRYYGLREFIDGGTFQFAILICIFANTVHIVINAEIDMHDIQHTPEKYQSHNEKTTRLIWDICFTAIYTIELLLKLYIHRCYLFLMEDWRWNLFDAILVMFSLFDNSMSLMFLEEKKKRPNLNFLRFLRILRISKILRMVRAVRWIHELRIMLDCVINSVLHLFWCLVLIVLVLVIFSLVLVQGMAHEMARAYEDDLQRYERYKAEVADAFGSVPRAMLSLFMATTGGQDWDVFYKVCRDAGSLYEIVFLFYIAFFCIVAWNIVMSTFVEKAFKFAVPDVETLLMDKRQQELSYSKELLGLVQSYLDTNHDDKISLKEFQEHFGDHKIREWFQARDFDMKDAEVFFRMLAAVDKKQEVDVRTFVQGCIRLRGTASNIDVQALHYDIRNMHLKQHTDFAHLSEQLTSCLSILYPQHYSWEGMSHPRMHVAAI